VSRPVPHFVTVQDASTEPAHAYQFESKREAIDFAKDVHGSGFVATVAKMFLGRVTDGVDRDPVKVWS
jgi:hypothetical protein